MVNKVTDVFNVLGQMSDGKKGDNLFKSKDYTP